MKAIGGRLYRRGKHGIIYIRCRIPSNLRFAYPPRQAYITRSLGTSDERTARRMAHAEFAAIEAEFDRKRRSVDLSQAALHPTRVTRLNDAQLQNVTKFWMRQILLNDEALRQAEMDDETFDEMQQQFSAQREELGRMLARGKSDCIYPALHSFLHMCGIDFQPDADEAKRASYAFLKATVESLGYQLARHSGEVVETDVVAPETMHPLEQFKPFQRKSDVKVPGWDEVFELWDLYVENRPKSTRIASQTPWRALRKFAESNGVFTPGKVTPELMTEFVKWMRDQGLAVDTINERILKVRAIYKIAVGRHALSTNPAAGTLGFKENSVMKRCKISRLAFDDEDLAKLFGSPIFTQHLRSKGQSGEASYWIPIIMFYTGARPEEVAGLAVADILEDPVHGWYFHLIDRPTGADADLFDDEVPDSHRRTLKNAPSVRRVPVARPLIDLGLLRYVEHLRNRGVVVLFPDLKKDWHGKLSGSFSKFFGRYLKSVGITDNRKVLYSFRHRMKNLMEAAKMQSKYLKRLLGHTSGDGEVTDGYGDDLPLEVIVEEFSRIQFPAIPAQPWQPGRGSIALKGTT